MPTIHPHLTVTTDALAQFCRRWKIMRVDLFGSVLRDDFDATSDVDLLVTFEEGVWYPIGDLLKMDDEAKALFGRDVDVVERRLVEENPNWVRRHSILSTATKVYAAA